MGIDETLEEINLVRSCLPDYRINLIDIRNRADIEKYRTSLQHVFSMVKYNKNKSKLSEYTRSHREEINRMDHASKAAALALLGEQKRLLKILEEKKEEGIDVCPAIDDLIADGERKGMEKERINFIRKQYNKYITAGQAAGILDLEETYIEDVMKLFKQYPNYTDDEIVSLLHS